MITTSIILCSIFSLNAQVFIGFSFNPPPIPSVSAGNDTNGLVNTTITLQASISGGTQPYEYHWSPGYLLNDSTSLTPQLSLTPQTYPSVVLTFHLTDANACAVSDDVTVTTVLTSVGQPEDQRLLLFPNPGRGDFTVRGLPPSSGSVQVILKDIMGRTVWDEPVFQESDQITLILSGIGPGVYIAELLTDHRRYTERVVVY